MWLLAAALLWATVFLIFIFVSVFHSFVILDTIKSLRVQRTPIYFSCTYTLWLISPHSANLSFICLSARTAHAGREPPLPDELFDSDPHRLMEHFTVSPLHTWNWIRKPHVKQVEGLHIAWNAGRDGFSIVSAQCFQVHTWRESLGSLQLFDTHTPDIMSPTWFVWIWLVSHRWDSFSLYNWES